MLHNDIPPTRHCPVGPPSHQLMALERRLCQCWAVQWAGLLEDGRNVWGMGLWGERGTVQRTTREVVGHGVCGECSSGSVGVIGVRGGLGPWRLGHGAAGVVV